MSSQHRSNILEETRGETMNRTNNNNLNHELHADAERAVAAANDTYS